MESKTPPENSERRNLISKRYALSRVSGLNQANIESSTMRDQSAIGVRLDYPLTTVARIDDPLLILRESRKSE
jgi:hypothetical protein